MPITLWTLLGFACWTLILLLILAAYRWYHIMLGQTTIEAVQPDNFDNYKKDIHRRIVRAHLNCVENLPVYASLVFIIQQLGLTGPVIDVCACLFIICRVIQSLIHIIIPQTEHTIPIRSTFYLFQMIIYGILIVMIIVH